MRKPIAIFGAGRGMFAGNFPVDKLWVDFGVLYRGFETIVANLPAAAPFALFAGTAAGAYNFPIASPPRSRRRGENICPL